MLKFALALVSITLVPEVIMLFSSLSRCTVSVSIRIRIDLKFQVYTVVYILCAMEKCASYGISIVLDIIFYTHIESNEYLRFLQVSIVFTIVFTNAELFDNISLSSSEDRS